MTPRDSGPHYEHEQDRGTSVQVALARLEAKLDVALADHSARIREGERRRDDHEDRLRFLEARPVVQPKHVYASIMVGIPILGLIETAVLAFLFR